MVLENKRHPQTSWGSPRESLWFETSEDRQVIPSFVGQDLTEQIMAATRNYSPMASLALSSINWRSIGFSIKKNGFGIFR